MIIPIPHTLPSKRRVLLPSSIAVEEPSLSDLPSDHPQVDKAGCLDYRVDNREFLVKRRLTSVVGCHGPNELIVVVDVQDPVNEPQASLGGTLT